MASVLQSRRAAAEHRRVAARRCPRAPQPDGRGGRRPLGSRPRRRALTRGRADLPLPLGLGRTRRHARLRDRARESRSARRASSPACAAAAASWSYGRIGAMRAFVVAAACQLALRHPPGARRSRPAPLPPPPRRRPKLPPPWEIRVDVLNGTAVAGRRHEPRERDRRPARLPAGHGRERRPARLRADARLLPLGAEAIARRLADELGVEMTALPSGTDLKRLLVIVGTDQAGWR